MSYKVATYFSADNWEQQGVNWVRTAKSQGLNGFVVGHNLPEEAVQKIKQLGFQHLPLNDDLKDSTAVYAQFIRQLEKSERCLWTVPTLMPAAGMDGNADLVCGLTEADIFALTQSVVNLYDRAAMIESLDEKIAKKYNGYLSAQYILASAEFWFGYLGCQQYMKQKEYVEFSPLSDDLVLNFFTAFANRFTVQIKDYGASS